MKVRRAERITLLSYHIPMKETLAYNVLQTMQWHHKQCLNAVEWWWFFERHYYHYDGIGKRLSDLVKFGLAERRWNDEKGYMLYQVSDKWLCIKSMEEYAQAVYKQPKPKKTREESVVKKENKELNYIITTNYKEWDDMIAIQPIPYDWPATSWYLREVQYVKDCIDDIKIGRFVTVPQPRYKRLLSVFKRA